MRMLAIESSCDDTAAAVVVDGTRALSNVVASQDDVHAKYGGVVPELASRRHLENVVPVISAALEQAETGLDTIDAVAVTQGPGLVGSLLVGISAAKAVAFAKRTPLVGVNHLMAHMLAVNLEEPVRFPFVGMVVSGGHTAVYVAEGFTRFRFLGGTRDDAAGEAFDKVAKYLGLGYPGGAVIERLARQGDPGAIPFPRAMIAHESLEFSFSGIKTAVINYVRTKGIGEEQTPDIAASFQEAVIDVLIQKIVWAVGQCGVNRVVVSGGVACNTRLRDRLEEVASAHGFRVHIPSPPLCRDNAAMIGVAGCHLLTAGVIAGYDMTALSRWPLGVSH